MKKITMFLAIILFAAIFCGASCMGTTENTNSKVLSETTTAPATAEDVVTNNAKLLELAITTGPADSQVTIIEASDFECPACRSIQPEFAKVIEKYRDQVQFGYVAYPLSYHKNALPAALAVEAANMQQKGWEMYEKLFAGSALDIANIETIAKDLGLDIDKFNTDREGEAVQAKIDESAVLLESLNLQGTPTFYINGVEFAGSPSFAGFEAEIKKLLEI